jgi:hypothetical protein
LSSSVRLASLGNFYWFECSLIAITQIIKVNSLAV